MTLCSVHLAQPQQPLVSFSAQVEKHPGAGSAFGEKANSVSGGLGGLAGAGEQADRHGPGPVAQDRVCLGVGGVLGPCTCWSCLPWPRSGPLCALSSGRWAPTSGAPSTPGTASLQSDCLIRPFAEGLLLLPGWCLGFKSLGVEEPDPLRGWRH